MESETEELSDANVMISVLDFDAHELKRRATRQAQKNNSRGAL